MKQSLKWILQPIKYLMNNKDPSECGLFFSFLRNLTADSRFPIWATETRREALVMKESNIKWLKIADLLYLTFINTHFQGLGHKCRQLWAMVCVYVSLAQYLKILRPYFICNILITTLIHALVRSLDFNFSYLVISGTKTNIGDITHNLIIWNTSHIWIVKTGWFQGINLHFIDSWLRVHFHQGHIFFIPPHPPKSRLPS